MTQLHLPIPNGEAIPYTLERRARKTVGLKINHNGLIVHAPTRLSQKELERMLLSKADWIVKKLQSQQENQLEKFIWQNGASLLLLGNAIELSVRMDSVSRALEYEPGRISIALPTPNNQASIAKKVLLWYKKQAQTDFTRRIALLAAKLGVETPPLFLSSARSRWGSCNSRGEVRLNWRLLQAPPHIINYVVAHELSHLRVMDHSPRFWDTVRTVVPDYAVLRGQLKDDGLPKW